jgi:hypothetical protein
MGIATKNCPGFETTVTALALPRCVCSYCARSTVNVDDGEESCDGDYKAFLDEKGTLR